MTPSGQLRWQVLWVDLILVFVKTQPTSFIESAYFVPSTVRRASRKFGIETDSSYRFARGTNPDAVALAMNRAAQLIQKFAGGEILSAHYDHYPRPIQHQTIFIDASTLTDRLGYKVDEVEFLDWMTRLGCDAKQINEPGAVTRWAVLPPSFRWDLAVDMDLVEEYARLHGYQHIPEKSSGSYDNACVARTSIPA